MEDPWLLFWSKVEIRNDCWIWTGALTRKGYGMYTLGSDRYRTNRLSWEFFNGPIPTGMWVLHHCDTPACVNPRHLFIGTGFDNTRDGMRKGRIRFKLTDEKVIEIRKMKESGSTYRQISEMFHVAIPTVQCIVERRRWKHLP